MALATPQSDYVLAFVPLVIRLKPAAVTPEMGHYQADLDKRVKFSTLLFDSTRGSHGRWPRAGIAIGPRGILEVTAVSTEGSPHL